jgi:cysteine-rich repeat protein
VEGGAAGVDQGVCGDGFRLLTEECDDGNASDEDACSSCSVLDFLAVSSSLVEPPPLGRRLGEGRHPLAADSQGLAVALVDVSGLAPAVQLARFAPGGSSLGGPVVVAEQLPLWDPHPVVAPLPLGHVVAWTAPDDDHLGVWMRQVPPGEALLPDPVRVNLAQDFGQSDPDVLWDGQQLVVAWVDASDLDTGYDLHFRTFDANLSPTSGEQKLAATLDAEAHVALAPFQGSWAAAWRSLSGGLERIQVRAGASSWSVGPFLPGPASDRPSLAQLDPDHLLLVFSEGVAAELENAPPSSRVVAAVLSLDATGELSSEQVTWVAPLAQGSEGLSQQQPHVLRVGTELWLAWHSEARPGDPLAEELWLKPLGWTLPEGTSPGGLELSAEELPLPRQAVHRPGDQRLPALAGFSVGDQPFLALAWEDLGRVFAPAGGDHEVVLQLAPLPLLRLEVSP